MTQVNSGNNRLPILADEARRAEAATISFLGVFCISLPRGQELVSYPSDEGTEVYHWSAGRDAGHLIGVFACKDKALRMARDYAAREWEAAT